MNNADFIDGLRKQDPAAAQHLNECYVPSIWRFVFFRVDRDSHLAEDIVSEAVLALVSAAASDQQIEHPGAWLRTVALRRIQDHFRAAARVQHLVEQAEQQVSQVDTEDPATKHDQNQQRQTVRDAMDELPEAYRIALEWKYVDKLSVKEIARRLETTEKAAESTLFRARNALRTHLNRDSSEPTETRMNAASSRTQISPPADDSCSRVEPESDESRGANDVEQTSDRHSGFLASKLAGES